MSKKIIINETLLHSLLMEMVKENMGIDEIKSADAYQRFYSEGKKFIEPEIYNSLMNSTDSLTPFHKMMLDAFLSGIATKDMLATAGSMWQNSDLEKRQYIVNMAKEDRDDILASPYSLNDFLIKTEKMKSHTENSFHMRGVETLFENDNLLVTCTKSYTSSCKLYGDSHWCTASDIFGNYNGFEMFESYTIRYDNEYKERGILVQFVNKENKEKSFQVQYQVNSEKKNPFPRTICNWRDVEVSERPFIRYIDSYSPGGNSLYAEIYNNYIAPNFERLYQETRENVTDEKEYYSRKQRIRLKKLIKSIEKNVASKEFLNMIIETAKKSIEKNGLRESGYWTSCEWGNLTIRGMNNSVLISAAYQGCNSSERDIIDNDDCGIFTEEELCQMTNRVIILDHSYNVLGIYKGYIDTAVKNIIAVTCDDEKYTVIDIRTGKVITQSYDYVGADWDKRWVRVYDKNDNEIYYDPETCKVIKNEDD